MLSVINPRRCSFRPKPTGPVTHFLGEPSRLGNARDTNKVLVVDDERDLADLITLLLRAYGFEAITVYSAIEALRLLEHDSDIDAVLSDIAMPEMDGRELGDAIRKKYPQIKVVLVSGYTFGRISEGRELPFLFATKPYTITTILKLLED